MLTLPSVALIGRPNVGKSTLFNRLVGKRQAVVSDIAGTTRDRLETTVTAGERPFTIIDVAGIEPLLKEGGVIEKGMQEQVNHALSAADVIVWVVDGREGITHADELVAELLRRQYKPVVIAVNKMDHPLHEDDQFEFARFGFAGLTPVSALHARGIQPLLEVITAVLPEEGVDAVPDVKELRLAIAGRPNVGKSTLLNALVGETRTVVSPEAGTTRDAVDTLINPSRLFRDTFTKWETVRIIDTAGIRRRGKIDRSIEGWSVVRTFDAIDQAEVVLLVIDGAEELVSQDLQIANRIVDAGRAMVLLVNKWDQVLADKNIIAGTEEDGAEQEKYLGWFRHRLPFLHWVQVLFLSAEKQINTDVIGKLVLNAYLAWDKHIDPADLKDLANELKKHPRLKTLRTITYEHSCPPVFHLHIHGNHLLHFSTRRMVENALRDFFDIGPTPIKIWIETSSTRQEPISVIPKGEALTDSASDAI